jgi:ATP-dependent Lhr-like helicase
LIQSHKSVLAFTNTRETAEVLSSRLRSLDRELKQAVHHGSLAKERRIDNEQKFKSQELKSLIATSSLELGIDIGSIDLVIQYLSPRQVAKLIQRVGRAGHKVGQTSKGIILSGDEDIFESTIIAKKAMAGELEQVKIHDSALDVLTTQIVGMTMDEYDASVDKIYRIAKRAYPYRNLQRKEFDELIKFLESLRLIWINNNPTGITINRRKKAFQYYFENLSTIPDTSKYRVVSIIQGEPIGNLDEAFVAEHGQPGEKFVFSGRAWKIIQVENDKVTVEPVEDIESAIPAWEGELIPVPFEIAQGVGRLRRYISDNLKEDGLAEKIMEKYHVDANSAKAMMKIIEDHKKTHVIPDDKTILIEDHKDFVILHTCFGSLVNDTIGRYLAALLIAQTGVAVNIKIDPYRIMLQTTANAELVRKLIADSKNLEEILISALERSSLFKYRFMHVARRFGVLSRGMRLDRINMNKVITQYADSPVYKETLREVFLEKMDLKNAQAALERIQSGEIKVKYQSGLSILGELGLTQQFNDVMKPRMPEKEIFLAFRRRLMATRVRLLCTNCAEYTEVLPVREVADQPECPKCGSRLIASVHKRRIDAVYIVKKKLKKKPLTEEEAYIFQRVRRSADLIVVYGKKAVVCLAARGIGPQTAARILATLPPTKEKLFHEILTAEKNFVRTKKYWK